MIQSIGFFGLVAGPIYIKPRIPLASPMYVYDDILYTGSSTKLLTPLEKEFPITTSLYIGTIVDTRKPTITGRFSLVASAIKGYHRNGHNPLA